MAGWAVLAVLAALISILVATHPRTRPGRVVHLPAGRADREMVHVDVRPGSVVVTVPHQAPAELTTPDTLREYLTFVRTLAPQAVSAHVSAAPEVDPAAALAALYAAGFTDLHLATVDLVRADVALRRGVP